MAAVFFMLIRLISLLLPVRQLTCVAMGRSRPQRLLGRALLYFAALVLVPPAVLFFLCMLSLGCKNLRPLGCKN